MYGIQETIIAAMNLMFRSGLTSARVVDLISVKPIGEMKPQIIEIYRSKFLSMIEKIKP